MTPASTTPSSRPGFSLIEVTLAIGIVGVAILSLVGILGSTFQQVDDIMQTNRALAGVSRLVGELADQTAPGIGRHGEFHGGAGVGSRRHEDDPGGQELRRLRREPAVRRDGSVGDRGRIGAREGRVRRADAADGDDELAEVVGLVVRVVKDEEAVAAVVSHAGGARSTVHQGHSAGRADGGRQEALPGRQTAAVTRRKPEEQGRDQQDDRDDQEEFHQGETLPDGLTHGSHWMAMTWAKSSAPRLSS